MSRLTCQLCILWASRGWAKHMHPWLPSCSVLHLHKCVYSMHASCEPHVGEPSTCIHDSQPAVCYICTSVCVECMHLVSLTWVSQAHASITPILQCVTCVQKSKQTQTHFTKTRVTQPECDPFSMSVIGACCRDTCKTGGNKQSALFIIMLQSAYDQSPHYKAIQKAQKCIEHHWWENKHR